MSARKDSSRDEPAGGGSSPAGRAKATGHGSGGRATTSKAGSGRAESKTGSGRAESKTGSGRAATSKTGSGRAATSKTGSGAPAKVSRQGGVAAGLARASGERARRHTTPLIGRDPLPGAVPPNAAAEPAPAPTTARSHRPQPAVRSAPAAKVTRLSGQRSTRRPARLGASTEGMSPAAPRLAAASPPPPQHPPPAAGAAAIEEIVSAFVQAMRSAASGAGMSADEAERKVATLLAFLRRRMEGDYEVDDFGYDPHFTEKVILPALRLLYRTWFRTEVRGIEHLPPPGQGALLVANHSGTIAYDALMLQTAVHDETHGARTMRGLAADFVFDSAFIGMVSRRTGATLATAADAHELLARGHLVGVFPEGFKGVGKPFRDRYKLQRFGRGGFVATALRAGVPIIPVSIVGAEEIMPMLGDLKPLARLLGMPYFPVTPTFPLLGLLGLIPLPSKWLIEFGTPIETDVYGAAGADDPMLVFDLTDQVRETIQQTLYSLLMQRRSVFF